MIAAALVGAAVLFSAPSYAQVETDTYASPTISKHDNRLSREVYGLGPWRLRLERDAFSGATRCTMWGHDGRLFYQPGAVGFDVGGRNLMDAAIRVDQAKAVSFRNLLPELAQARARIGGRDMDRPTDGLVWVPVARLETARRVAIAPHFGGGIRHFSIEGLERLIFYARSQGCEPEGARP